MGIKFIFALALTSSIHIVFLSNPFRIGVAFFFILILFSLVIAITNTLLGLILFIVYVGGMIVLFTYCFILIPLQEFYIYPCIANPVIFTSFLAYLYIFSDTQRNNLVNELYLRGVVMIIIGLVLLLVMLSVVELVECSKGSLRIS